VAGKGVKVDVEVAHVGGVMRDPLRAVGHDNRAALVREPREQLTSLIVPSELLQVHDGDDLHPPAAQDLLVLLDQQLPAVVHRDDAKLRARLLTDDLPGHDVRVMLHRGDDDFVAALQISPTVRRRDQVDPSVVPRV
jgi:hypothetical protein